LHIDTQGSDLEVLKGLKNKLDIVDQGVLEAATQKETSLYETNHTIDEVKKFLQLNNFKISKIENIDENIDKEKNIFFNKKNLNINFKINKKYNTRYYQRIINDRLNLKDKIFDKIKKFLFIRSY